MGRAAPRDDVFDTLADGSTYPAWWKPVYIDVTHDGEYTLQHFKGRLPYHLHTRTRTTHSERPHRLQGETDGDLRGTGIWTLTENADGSTHVRFDWRVHADRRLLKLLTPILRPVPALEPQLGDRPRDRRPRALRPRACKIDGLSSKATPATKALERAKVPVKTHAYEHDRKHESYGLEAAEALGLDPATVFKTLVADVDGKLTVAIVPVEFQLDLKALAQAVKGKKAQMADVKQAERTTGYVAGGISPLGQRRRCRPCSTRARSSTRRSTSRAAVAAWRSSSRPPTCNG